MLCVASLAAGVASRTLLPVLLAVGSDVQPAFSQEEPARLLTGTVVAKESGEPLENVLVELESQGLQALTDSMGRFRIAGARPGVDTVRASYFNLTDSRMPVDLTSSGGHQVELTLSAAAFEVADLVVEIDAVPREAHRLARRIEAGMGELILGAELRRWTPRLIYLFRMTHRTRLQRVAGEWVVLFRGFFRYCRPAVFENARASSHWVLSALSTRDVQAVELYWDPFVPGEFYRSDRCGAINIWTERY